MMISMIVVCMEFIHIDDIDDQASIEKIYKWICLVLLDKPGIALRIHLLNFVDKAHRRDFFPEMCLKVA